MATILFMSDVPDKKNVAGVQPVAAAKAVLVVVSNALITGLIALTEESTLTCCISSDGIDLSHLYFKDNVV
jgi:hypothetical protein